MREKLNQIRDELRKDPPQWAAAGERLRGIDTRQGYAKHPEIRARLAELRSAIDDENFDDALSAIEAIKALLSTLRESDLLPYLADTRKSTF